MKITAAVTRHRAKKFVAVSVKRGTTVWRTKASAVMNTVSRSFGGMSVVLVEDAGFGRSKYYGDRSIVSVIGDVHPTQLPWRDYWI